jgi:hypothetical protein
MRSPTTSAGVLSSLLLVGGLLGCSSTNATGPSCSKSYCGSTGLKMHLNCKHAGLGYSCSGTATLAFNPAPDDMVVTARLNAGSISGQARTDGKLEVEVPIRGSAVACPFVNPSNVTVTDSSGIAIAQIDFNWENTGCN